MGKPQVVITRKDKRLKKGWHLLAFVATGGMSAPVTAAKAASNAAYNARTGKLAGPSGDEEAEFRAEHVPASRDYKERHRTGKR
jgi:hypothetical protein